MKKRTYLNNVKACSTVDELVWVQTDACQDSRLAWRDLEEVLKLVAARRKELEAAGDSYHRARKPSFAK